MSKIRDALKKKHDMQRNALRSFDDVNRTLARSHTAGGGDPVVGVVRDNWDTNSRKEFHKDNWAAIRKGVQTGWQGIIPPPATPDIPKPVAVADEQELARVKQKSLQRRANGGRSSTVMSGGSGLG